MHVAHNIYVYLELVSYMNQKHIYIGIWVYIDEDLIGIILVHFLIKWRWIFREREKGHHITIIVLASINSLFAWS